MFLLDMVALCLFKELAFQPLTHSSVNKGRNPSKIKKEEMRFANNYNENQKTNQTAKYWERVTAFGRACIGWPGHSQHVEPWRNSEKESLQAIYALCF